MLHGPVLDDSIPILLAAGSWGLLWVAASGLLGRTEAARSLFPFLSVLPAAAIAITAVLVLRARVELGQWPDGDRLVFPPDTSSGESDFPGHTLLALFAILGAVSSPAAWVWTVPAGPRARAWTTCYGSGWLLLLAWLVLDPHGCLDWLVD